MERGGGDPQIGTRRSGGAVVGGLTKEGRVRRYAAGGQAEADGGVEG